MDRGQFKKAIQDEVFLKATPERHIVDADGKLVPWLFDFRALLLQPRWLNEYAEFFLEHCADKYPFQVCAMESAGIALVAAIVMKGVERKKPINGLFIRKSRKREGLMKQIEGTPTSDPIILVDDLINSGTTFKKQIDILHAAGLSVSGIFTVLSFREYSAYAFLSKYNIHLTSLFTLEDFKIPLLSNKSPLIPRESFETLWRFKPPHPSYNYVNQKSTPVLDEDTIYFGADNGTMYALDQKTGEIKWSFTIGKHPEGKGIFSSPVLFEGIIYFGGYDGTLYALNASTGDLIWKNTDADWIGSSPTLAPDLDLIFIGQEFGLVGKQGGIAALDMRTGHVKWNTRTQNFTHGTPLYIRQKNMVVCGSNDGILYALNAITGALLWKYATSGHIKSSASYDSVHEQILFCCMNGTAYALSLAGIPVWAFETGAGIYSTPLVEEDTVYIASLDKSVYAVSTESGRKKWSFDTSGRIFASPTIIEGSLWCGSNDGRVYELDPENGTLRNYFQTTERIVNKIAYNFTSRTFFIPTFANELYCVKRIMADVDAKKIYAK